MSQSYFDLNALLDHFIDIGEITQHKTLQLEKIEALLERQIPDPKVGGSNPFDYPVK